MLFFNLWYFAWSLDLRLFPYTRIALKGSWSLKLLFSVHFCKNIQHQDQSDLHYKITDLMCPAELQLCTWSKSLWVEQKWARTVDKLNCLSYKKKSSVKNVGWVLWMAPLLSVFAGYNEYLSSHSLLIRWFKPTTVWP